MNSISGAFDRSVLGPHTAAPLRTRATWSRVALAALLTGTALAYLIDLSASGYANSFYAAAVQAGTKSWKALFFGSLDSSNFITVDKPPASLWVMALSGRIFGFSSWSMLVPQALEGVAAVALLYAGVKRWFGSGAGLLAGALFAITPVAALMFRFNNPDALLVLLLVAGAYCLIRALEKAGTRWVVAAGTMIGLAFLAKMLQAFIVLPGFAAVYMYAAPTGLGRRIRQTLVGGGAVLVSAGWWVAITALWPAGSRPMIDGSTNNSILNLITGYNGLERVFSGGGPGGGSGGGAGANFSGSTGVLRLFNSLMGGQASWLLPASLLALGGCLWARRGAARTDRVRAALLLWGGWLIVTAIVFSFGSGVIHTYYTVALAPAIAALVAIGSSMLWSHRDHVRARVLAAGTVAGTGIWAYLLLDRTPSWEPWLRAVVAVATALSVLGLLAAPPLARVSRRAGAATLALAALGCLAGPVAYAADTISTPHNGSIASAGPAVAGSGARPVGAPPMGGFAPPERGAFGAPVHAGSFDGPGETTTSKALVTALRTDAGRYRWVAAVGGSQTAASLELATGGQPVMAIGGFNGNGGNVSLSTFERYVSRGQIHYYVAPAPGSAVAGPPGAEIGGPAGSAVAGPPGAEIGGPPGPGIGGLLGTGVGRPPGVGVGGPPGGAPARTSTQIATWVRSHYRAVTIGGQTVYDLTQRVA